MHRGRGENRSACNDRGAPACTRKPLGADQESSVDHGRNKRERLNLSLSSSQGKNLPGYTDSAAGQHNRILVIRRQSSDAVSHQEARLDSGVADNVIDFLSTFEQVPEGVGTRGIQHILSKPDVQGRARAVLSSLHDECKKKLLQGGGAKGTGNGESVPTFSCRISRGPALSQSLEWPSRQKQSQKQVFAVVSSLNPHLAGNRVNGSSLSLQQAGRFGERRLWNSRSDVQQRQPNMGCWWRRILFGGLAGAAGIRLMSLKYPWLLLSELVSLPCFRRNGRQNSEETVERRNWWRIPVKVATAISSRFCGSLSNSFVAAHLLLLIFELRSLRGFERSADSNFSAPKDHVHVGRRCCSCLASSSQGGAGAEVSNITSRPTETLNSSEDIAHMLVGLARKGRDVKNCSAGAPREEDVVHLAEAIHAALLMRKQSLDKLLHAESSALTPALEVRNSCGEEDSQVSISFVSKDFPEGIELVFPQNIPSNEDRRCIAASTMDPQYQSAQTASRCSIEGDPQAAENSALLKSILLEKCKSGPIYRSKSSVYASDVESEYFFETCSLSLPDLEHAEYQQPQELDLSSERFEGWKSTHSDVSSIHGDDHALTREAMACYNSRNCVGCQSVEIQNAESLHAHHRPDTHLNDHPHLQSTTRNWDEETIPAVAPYAPHHFADHPTCISRRERRYEYEDQKYLTPHELKSPCWRELVFWHGHCRQGKPTLCILLGKAVRQLPAAELQIISSVIISQMEYAELNFFNGSAKQMNIIMDLWGIGLMRMPPLEILSRVGMIMNRDYAGRGGSILLINAPVMLSLVIGAIKRVILRPGYNKGALIEKGFLEKKDQILFFNRNYKHALEKHFDMTLLPSMFGGKCDSKFCPEDCGRGVNFLETL